jgi:hypothetical protein
MSDYIPDPRSRPGSNDRFEYSYEPASTRSSFALVGLLTVLALIGGVLFFGADRPNDQQAMEPPAAATTPSPATPANPAPAPATPAPTAPRQ